MIEPSTKDIIKIVRTYAYQNGMTLTEFARKAEVSKSWISRLRNEDAEISLNVARKLLNTAGYKIVVKHQSQLTTGDQVEINMLSDEEIEKLKQNKGASKTRLRKVILNEKNSDRE